MSPDFVFWNDELQCPVVCLAGAVFEREGCEAVAGYSVLWGDGDDRNCTGSLGGIQTQLRAELAALRRALQMAVTDRIPTLVFLTDSCQLDIEIGKWEEADLWKRLKFDNSDLHMAIQELQDAAEEYTYFLAIAERPDQRAAISQAFHMAEESLSVYKSTPSSRTSPDSGKDDSWSDAIVVNTRTILPVIPSPRTTNKTAVVTIRGIKKSAEKSVYMVHWGDNDSRNNEGTVHSPVYQFKAEFLALNAALCTAVDTNISRLLIRTCLQNVKDIFDSFRINNQKPKKTFEYTNIAADCVELANMLESVTIEFVSKNDGKTTKKRPKTAPITQMSFAIMPNQLEDVKQRFINLDQELQEISVPSMSEMVNENAFPKSVYVTGVCHGRGYTTGKAIYSVFWAPNDPRNSIGIVPGIVNNTRTKLFAVMEALRTAIQDGIRNLVIRVDDLMVLDTLNLQTSPIGNVDVMSEIEDLIEQMNSVQFELTPYRQEFLMAGILAEREYERVDHIFEEYVEIV